MIRRSTVFGVGLVFNFGPGTILKSQGKYWVLTRSDLFRTRFVRSYSSSNDSLGSSVGSLKIY